MRTARSKNGATIRLPDERWVHITEEHSELAGYLHDVLETIEEPSAIYAGNQAELLAIREIASGKFLVVIYKRDRSNGRIRDNGVSSPSIPSVG